MRPLPGTSSGFAASGSPWPRVWDALQRRRKAWLLNWAVIVVGAAVVSLLLPKWYVATATLLPPSEESDLALSFTQLLRGGALSSGRLPRTTSPEDIFSAILTSRAVGRAAVRRFDLARVYRVRKESEAIDLLEKHLTVGTTRLGVVAVSVEDRSPARAADLANFLVDELDTFNKDVRMTAGKSARLFVERRLLETQEALRQAEDRLKAYQIRHGVPVSGPEEGGASAGAEAFAQRIALQVKLETLLRTESESSEDVRRARAQLDALGGELKRLPEAGTEMARLLREVKIQDQVYILLTAQDEEAKVREHKDTPTVQVLDRAETPEKKSRPRRSLIVATAAILGLVESCLWALYLDRGRGRMRPAPLA